MSKSRRSFKGQARHVLARSMRAMESMIAHREIRADNSCQPKKAYSQGQALAARIALGRKRKRVTIYHCRFCNKYHLTSMGAER